MYGNGGCEKEIVVFLLISRWLPLAAAADRLQLKDMLLVVIFSFPDLLSK
jgi:hypothetical protein